jgi:hypothetical protein
MSSLQSLQQAFVETQLPLEPRAAPISWQRDGDEDIVQIDINSETRAGYYGERFRVFRGHEDNRLEVLAHDAEQRQLVLFVDEPVRAFEVALSRRERVPLGATITRKARGVTYIEQYTSGRARHFLCGMDESHLFIAMLPEPVRSVREAHEALRDPRVDELEIEAPEPTIRQGEWFFVALPEAEQEEVKLLARKVLRVAHDRGIAEVARINRIGRPHIASEIVVVPPHGDRDERVYVRGAIRHPDHRTIRFDSWRRVIPNREHLEAPLPGIEWYD